MQKNIITLNHAIFKLKHLIIPILIAVLILSCTKEKNQLSPSSDNIDEIKKEFYAQNPLADNENFFNSNFTSYIKWDSIVVKDENNVYIKISSAEPIYYVDSTFSINLADYFWLKAQKKDNKWGYSFISFLPNSEATREQFQGKIVTKFLSSNKIIIREYKGDINSSGLIAGFPPMREPCVYAYVAGELNAVYCSAGGDDDYEQWLSGGPKDYSNIPPSTGSPGGTSSTSPSTVKYKFENYACMEDFLKNLENLSTFKDMVKPFTLDGNGTGNPNLQWSFKTDMSWDPNKGYNYGLASATNPNESTNRDVDIYFNANALNNSSDLVIAATALHEAIHAYSNYFLKTNKMNADGIVDEKIQEFWFTSALKTLEIQKKAGLNGDYRDHQTMMSDNVFPVMIGFLKAWGGNRYSSNEYVMASMLGLGQAGQMFDPSVNAQMAQDVSSLFDKLKKDYKITDAAFNEFLKTHSNVDPNGPLNNKKISCAK